MSFGSFRRGHDDGDSCAWTALSILGLEYASPNATKKLMHVPEMAEHPNCRASPPG